MYSDIDVAHGWTAKHTNYHYTDLVCFLLNDA